MKHASYIYNGVNHLGDNLAVTSWLVDSELHMDFQNLPPDEQRTHILWGEFARLCDTPPREIHTPVVEFNDGRYPFIAAACRAASLIVADSFGDASAANISVRPHGTMQGVSRVGFEGDHGADIVAFDDIRRYIVRPVEMAFAGFVAAYNALTAANTAQLRGIYTPSGVHLSFDPAGQKPVGYL